MSSKMSGKLILMTVLMLIMLIFVGCKDDVQVKLTTGLSEGELFRIEKKACTEAEARLFLMNQKNRYEASYGENIWNVSLEGENFAGQMKEQLHGFLYQLKGMVLMAEARDITLSDEEKKLTAEAAKEYVAGLSAEALTYLNMTEEQLTQLFREYRLAERLVAQVTAIVDNEISDDEARVIEVQQIVVPLVKMAEDGSTVTLSESELADARSKAQKAADRAAAGDAFTTLQELYSSETVGSIRVSRYDVEDAWENAVFTLGSGEVSGVIEAEEALYVVRCINNMLMDETIANKEVIRERKKADVFYQEYNAFVANLMVQSDAEGWQTISFMNEVPVCDVDFYEIYEQYFPQ